MMETNEYQQRMLELAENQERDRIAAKRAKTAAGIFVLVLCSPIFIFMIFAFISIFWAGK
jgi:hypothetical protein